MQSSITARPWNLSSATTAYPSPSCRSMSFGRDVFGRLCHHGQRQSLDIQSRRSRRYNVQNRLSCGPTRQYSSPSHRRHAQRRLSCGPSHQRPSRSRCRQFPNRNPDQNLTRLSVSQMSRGFYRGRRRHRPVLIGATNPNRARDRGTRTRVNASQQDCGPICPDCPTQSGRRKFLCPAPLRRVRSRTRNRRKKAATNRPPSQPKPPGGQPPGVPQPLVIPMRGQPGQPMLSGGLSSPTNRPFSGPLPRR